MIDDPLPIRQLVPHSGAMCLLDRIVRHDEESLVAEVCIRADGPFTDSLGPGSGVGAWVAIEYMAQAVAAWAGLQSRKRGESPKIGFLLGSRRVRTCVSSFAVGQVLWIEVRPAYQADNGLGQFDCRLLSEGQEWAQAQLTVFGPADPEGFLKESTHG